MIYLAAPYTHPDPKVMDERVYKATEVAAMLIALFGVAVLSPLTLTHPIAKVLEEQHGLESGPEAKLDHNFWVGSYDAALLRACDTIAVLQLDGWSESTGVQMELDLAEEYGMKVIIINPFYLHDRLTKIMVSN